VFFVDREPAVTQPATIRLALTEATATLTAISTTPRLDAELLLAHTTGWSRAQLLAHSTDPLTAPIATRYATYIARRCTGESVAYITQHREFYGHAFYVDARVLVPRPETELLVDIALDAARRIEPAVIVDIGSGSGCIGVALAHAQAAPMIVAVDISADALAVTAINRDRHHLGPQIHLVQADLCMGLSPVQMIVSNPPYVMDDDGDADVRQHEPHLALFGGDDDGAAVYRRLAHHLRAPGFFGCEIDPRQEHIVCDLLRSAFPHGRIDVHHDLAGHARVVSLWIDGTPE
jgi:release factor glutamine methyltransferase